MSKVQTERSRISIHDWPEADRHAWHKAIAPGDVFSDPGPAAKLSEVTKRGYEGTYGRWLRFLWLRKGTGPEHSGIPSDISIVQEFIHISEARISLVSVWSEVSRLHNFCYYTWPEQDWAPLREIVNRLHQRLPPPVLSPGKVVPIDELYALGLYLMARSSRVKPYRPFDDSVMYRDGLMISLLAAAPVRRKNLAQLMLGRELECIDDTWIMTIPGEDTKNGQSFDVSFPEQISRAIDIYMQAHRRRLQQGFDTDAFWLSKEARPMSVNRVGQRITQVTERYLGKAISPHRFRHAAATSIATHAPDLAPMIQPLLAHTSSRTAERYYNKASSRSASLRIANNITSLKERFGGP